MIMDDWWGYITMRIGPSNELSSRIEEIAEVFNKYNAAYPFDYQFADQEFQKKFSTIKMTSRLASIFAFLAIFITGLGLFGLAAFTAERRTKEIGVRKVMGATVMSIINLLSRDFSILVIVAFFITSPFAWWALNNYLDRYPIRIDIVWWIFPASCFRRR